MPARVLDVEDVLAIEGFSRTYGPLFDFSPCRTHVAIALTGGLSSVPRASPPLLTGVDRAHLCVIDLTTREVRHLNGPDGYSLFSPVWSPRGTRIAAAASNGESTRLCVVDVVSGHARLLGEQDLRIDFSPVAGMRWISEAALVCRLLPPGAQIDAIHLTHDTRKRASAAWRQQHQGQQATASALQMGADEERGDITVIDIATGSIESFPDENAMPDAVADFANRPIPFTSVDAQIEDLHAKDRILFSDAATGQVLSVARSGDGTTTLKWRPSGASDDFALIRCNVHLADVRKSAVRDLTYRLQNGSTAVTRCILPPDWQEGQRRPAIVFVYPEICRHVGSPEHRMPDQPGWLNLHLLAAQGYVVLEPSLPFCRDGKSDLIDSLAAGVEPALDAAAEAGLIDRAHVHVLGHSRGGWAAMGLLAMTARFRSGISLAGFSDLIALHGQLDGRWRYRDRCDAIALDEPCENSFALPGPPAQHADAYIRNSPLFRAASIDAPLLMLHGDLDSYPPITQSEAMFHALHRLGKPVEFIRYWGEEHIFASPANVRDAFGRIVAWLQALSPVSVA